MTKTARDAAYRRHTVRTVDKKKLENKIEARSTKVPPLKHLVQEAPGGTSDVFIERVGKSFVNTIARACWYGWERY